jgi:ribose 5-phosphate isomerase B
MRIAIGSDHAGFRLKEQIHDYLQESGLQVEDVGVFSEDSADYPDTAFEVAMRVARSEVEAGVLICGTGVGMSIAANKVHGIRAAHASDPVTARLSREHNNANIVCLGSRIIGTEVAKAIVHTFLTTPFNHDSRHQRRIDKIEKPGVGRMGGQC